MREELAARWETVLEEAERMAEYSREQNTGGKSVYEMGWILGYLEGLHKGWKRTDDLLAQHRRERVKAFGAILRAGEGRKAG